MTFTVRLRRSAEKELDSLPAEVRRRIVKRLLALGKDPHPRGAEKLSGNRYYRIRVGDYRILFAVNHGEQSVDVAAIGHRSEVYR